MGRARPLYAWRAGPLRVWRTDQLYVWCHSAGPLRARHSEVKYKLFIHQQAGLKGFENNNI
jgi:hypothetical protein